MGVGEVSSGEVGATLKIVLLTNQKIVTDHRLYMWHFVIGHSLVSGYKTPFTLPF